MRSTIAATLVALLFYGVEHALAASWSFKDATIQVQSKGQGVGGGSKETYEITHQLSFGKLTLEQID